VKGHGSSSVACSDVSFALALNDHRSVGEAGLHPKGAASALLTFKAMAQGDADRFSLAGQLDLLT
jgi:hypothetical protein